MGISYQTYVGPYIRCSVGQAQTTATRNACTNSNCTMHTRECRSSFCGVCGSPIGTVEYPVTKAAIDQWEVIEELNERLTNPSGETSRSTIIIYYHLLTGMIIYYQALKSKGGDA